MQKYARLLAGEVVELMIPPEGFTIADCFVKQVADQFIKCPANITVGSKLSSAGEWTVKEDSAPTVVQSAPIEPDVPAKQSIKVSPVEFKLLFTSPERIAIKQLIETDQVIEDFFSIIDDPRLTCVDLGLNQTVDALSYLVQLDVITADRKAEILTGELK